MKDSKTDNLQARRPLKVRDAGFARGFAAWLSGKMITPNQISVASVAFAALSALCFLSIPALGNGAEYGLPSFSPNIALILLPLLAALFIQLRLLCNLFDGMVAVEGGKRTASGELFNDIPDRIADPLILVSAGYAMSSLNGFEALGWCAGVLSVMTAYVRTLAASIGAPVNFQGPMAKQHRMALMTAAAVVAAVEWLLWPPGYAFAVALAIVCVGSVLTVVRRTLSAYRYLEGQAAGRDS
jgi:phosphatidylglycerophosphate synthase